MSKSEDSRAIILEQLNLNEAFSSEKEVNYSGDEIFENNQKSLYDQFIAKFQAIQGKFFEVDSLSEIEPVLVDILKEKKIKNIVSDHPEFSGFFEKIQLQSTNEITDFAAIQASITSCELLIARHGSILISSRGKSGRRLHIIPDMHIVIAYKNQLVHTLKEAFEYLDNKYQDDPPSMFSIISGPSRTADIEKTLIMGAHGPKEILLFLVNNQGSSGKRLD